MEYVLVSFPEEREVNVDGSPFGLTNAVLYLETGLHVFSLSGPNNFVPTEITTAVVNTQLRRPLVVRFDPVADVAVTARSGKSKTSRLSAPAVDVSRRLAFVAMPFAEAFSDVFHYGIRGAADRAGFDAVRLDQEVFTGEVLGKMKEQIANSTLVIADLSTSNPNVYLEVGYAWGLGKPTVLIVNDKSDVKFDLQGQRYLKYATIKSLETVLTNELKALAV